MAEGSIHLYMGMIRALTEKKAAWEIKASLLVLKSVNKDNLPTFMNHPILLLVIM